MSDSSNNLNEPTSTDDMTNESGGIFGKRFNFLGFGCENVRSNVYDSMPFSYSGLSPEEIKRQREQIEKRMINWSDDGLDHGGVPNSPLCDSSHPALNPPLFLSECIPPPDG